MPAPLERVILRCRPASARELFIGRVSLLFPGDGQSGPDGPVSASSGRGHPARRSGGSLAGLPGKPSAGRVAAEGPRVHVHAGSMRVTILDRPLDECHDILLYLGVFQVPGDVLARFPVFQPCFFAYVIQERHRDAHGFSQARPEAGALERL